MVYTIHKRGNAWRLCRVTDEGVAHEIAKYKTRKQARVTAWLLAGPCGTVILT